MYGTFRTTLFTWYLVHKWYPLVSEDWHPRDNPWSWVACSFWLTNALIPHFDYGSCVWSNCSASDQAHLQVLHNRLARTILSADIRTLIDNLPTSMKWIKLCNRWSNHMLILTFKCPKNMCPDYLCNQFNFVHNMHNHITRSHTSKTLIVRKCNSNSGKRTFLVRAANLWNNVPPSIRTELDNLTLYLLKQMSLLHHFKYFCLPYQFYEFCFLYNHLSCTSVNIMFNI